MLAIVDRSKRGIFGVLLISLACLFVVSAFAKPPKKHKKSKEERRREKAIRKEMESPYKHWIQDEVPYIITPEERKAFKQLTTDEEREQFIEQFWERRNPNPGSPENAFKEEYYRRIAYANEHFSSGVPGWKTDRGRIYIMYGPPDEIDSHPSGGTTMVDPSRMPYTGPGAAQEMVTYPYETWRYRYIPGIGTNIVLEFVDPTMTGEYRLTMNPCEKDALATVPGDMTGCAGPVSQGPIFNPNEVISPQQLAGGGSSGANVESNLGMPASMDEFNQLDLYAKIFKPPAIKFKDLRAVVTSRLTPQLLPFDVREDFIKVTDQTVLTPITIQVENKNLEFQNKNGVMHAVLDIYGRLTTLSGRIASTFEDSVALDVPAHDFQKYETQRSVYQKVVPLRPGLYKLSVVIKDDLNGHMGSMDLGIHVPHFSDEKLSNSSLILADLIQPLPTSEVGSGPFVIGGTKVRPSVDRDFTHTQNLGIYMQVYNLGVSPKTHRPAAEIQYTISKDGKAILNQVEDASKYKDASEQLTIEKRMPLKSLPPGKYTVHIKVTDKIKNQTIDPSATFDLR